MSNIDFNKAKEQHNSIKMPDDLDTNLMIGMKSGIRKRKIRSRVPIYSIAVMFIGFILCINTSVVFAQAVKNIPIIKDFADIVIINEGIKYALKEGYIQPINKSVDIDGIKVTITRVIGDSKQLIFGYTIEGKGINEEDYYGLKEWEIKDSKGNKFMEGILSSGYGDYRKDGLEPLKGEKYFSIENTNVKSIPRDLILTFNGIVNNSKYDGIIASGEREIPIELNEKIVSVEPEIYSVNKNVELGEQSLFIKEMRVYPMGTEIVVSNLVDKENKFGWLDNCYLEDEKGRTFTLSSATPKGEGSEDYILTFNGGAYGRAKELTLYSKGMFYNPIKERQLVVDVRNQILLQGGEYGLKLEHIKDYKEVKNLDEDNSYKVIYPDEESDEASNEDIIYEAMEVKFTILPPYGIENISISHPDAIRSSSSQRADGTGGEVSLYFNKYTLKAGKLYINIDSMYNNKMKTEEFSARLK
ncbi:DUF4179 domain-containing protein [uncultured Clostridium sp.]|uniref:DUF4179 domain-containing protein n=1 Tax=uncultured Clostridium sp. TaxID=59620 RepID=UPI003217FF81